MGRLRSASALCVVAVLCCGVSCKNDGDDDPGGAVATHGKDGGAASGGRGGSSGGSGAVRDGGTSASGGRDGGGGPGGSSAGGEDGGGTGGEVDAGDPTKCAGVSCPAPSVCDREAMLPTCVCPPGFHFSDLGDDQSPCQPDCNEDCDAG